MALIISFAACICGLVAAYYWWRSSKAIPVAPWSREAMERNDTPLADIFEYNSRAGPAYALEEGGRLNGIAAVWTAISVLLSGLASLTSVLAH